MPRKYLLLFLFVSFFGWNCSQQDNIKPGKQIIGLASPITLSFDTTQVNLLDYFMYPENLDSITNNSGLNLEWSADKKNLIIGRPMEANLGIISFHENDTKYDVLIKDSDLEEVIFTLDDKNYKKVQVKGEMNSWNANATPLTKKDGVWQATMRINKGLYQYLFVVDGKEMKDPNNPVTVSNGMGGYNNLLEVGNTDLEKTPILKTESNNGSKITLNANQTDNVIVFWQNHRLNTTQNGDQITFNIPAAANKLDKSYIRAWAYNKNGVSNDILIPLNGNKIVQNPSDLARTDAHNWNMYFILVDRFKDGNPDNTRKLNDPEVMPQVDYFGGDLAGITQAINDGYFEKIGVNSLWISPISQNPDEAYGLWDEGGVTSKFSGYHGYWPVSSSKIDDRFGTEAEFKELLNTAHKNGMSVILDYVANHVHELHPVYQNNKDWATDLYLPDGRMNTELWDEERLTTWFDIFMPSLDFSRPEVIETMTDSALFWIKEYPLDGFRHDATKHIQLEFWRTLTRKIKEQVITGQDKEVFQIGETYGSRELVASYINSGMLDSQFDFNMYDASLNAFGQNFSFKSLAEQLQESFNYFGYHNTMGIISGNHDKPRFVSLTSGEVAWDEDSKLAGWTRKIGKPQKYAYNRLKMLHAFNLTIPGIPVTYTGDEYGAPGANDPDNRRWMIFEDNKLDANELETRNTFARLSQLRKTNMALVYGDFQFILEEDDQLAYSRKYFNNFALVIFNKSDDDKTISIEIEDHINADKLEANFGSEFKINNGRIEITLPSNTFEILTI